MYEDYYINQVFIALFSYFDSNDEKVGLWVNTPNPLLGDVKPIDMLSNGRAKKLYEFVKTQIEEGAI